MIGRIGVFILAIVVVDLSALYVKANEKAATPAEVVMKYHGALIEGDAAALTATIGAQIAMYNGTDSEDQLDWQAHMFIEGDQVREWAGFMTTGAAPHKNDVTILKTDMRAGLALVVTRETGSNKFMTWQDSRVVYILGQGGDGWKIVGLYLPEASNPE